VAVRYRREGEGAYPSKPVGVGDLPGDSLDDDTPTLVVREEVVSFKSDNTPDVAVKSLVLSAVRRGSIARRH